MPLTSVNVSGGTVRTGHREPVPTVPGSMFKARLNVTSCGTGRVTGHGRDGVSVGYLLDTLIGEEVIRATVALHASVNLHTLRDR